MTRIERSYKLRLYCLLPVRVFSDEFLLSLSYRVKNDEEKEKYLDILIREFRVEIPRKFLEGLL